MYKRQEDDSTNVEIELRDLKTILDDVIIGDYAEFHAEETHKDLLGGYAVTIDKFISDRVLSKITEFNQKALLNSSAKKPYKPIEISEDGLELIEFLSVDCTATDVYKRQAVALQVSYSLKRVTVPQIWFCKPPAVACVRLSKAIPKLLLFI